MLFPHFIHNNTIYHYIVFFLSELNNVLYECVIKHVSNSLKLKDHTSLQRRNVKQVS